MRIKNNHVLPVFFLLLSALLAGCATYRAAASKPGFDFTKIKTIGIGEFSPFNGDPNSSEIFKDEFSRELILAGYNVKRSVSGVDVLLSGTVTEYSPAKKYFIYEGDDHTRTNIEGGRNVIINQSGNTFPGVEIPGSNVYSLGDAFGFGEKGKIMVTNATAGVTARIVDPVTSEIVWTDSFSYEGLDAQTAVEAVVNYIIKSLTRNKK